MKKIILIFLTFTFMQSNAFSFDLVSVGIQGGLNASLPRTSPEVKNLSQRNSPMGGMFFETLFNEDHGILFDLLYNQKGGAFKTDLGVLNEFRYDYISIDALYKLTFFRQSKFRPSVFAGPSFGYLVQSIQTTSVGGPKADAYIRRDSNHFELSAIGGLWFEYDASENLTVVAQGRYEHGLSVASKSTNLSWINQSTELMVGVKFPL